MKLYSIYFCLYLVVSFFGLQAQPMIRSIKNNTDFLYKVIGHNDMSGCSEFNRGGIIEIEPFSTYEFPFLLGSEKPGLLLQPIAYYDKKADCYYFFIDAAGHFVRENIQRAFDAWQHNFGKKYNKGLDVWLAQWLCGDISLIHNHVEVFGYLMNTALTRVENKKNFHVCMIDYSEGLFSRLFLDITIEQKRSKGVVPYVKSFVGQGGFCQDGKIITLG